MTSHLTRRVFHCGCCIIGINSLTYWPPKVPLARSVHLRTTLSSAARGSSGDIVHSLVLITSIRRGYVAGVRDLILNSLLRRHETLLKLISVL